MSAFAVFCPAGLPSNSVRGLHLQREQDRAWGGKTARKWLPAILARCTALKAFTHSRVCPSWRPCPRPKTRSASQHGKSRGPGSGLCPARGVPTAPTAVARAPPWHTPRSRRLRLWKICPPSLPLQGPCWYPTDSHLRFGRPSWVGIRAGRDAQTLSLVTFPCLPLSPDPEAPEGRDYGPVPACRPQLLAQASPEGWRGPLGSAQRPQAPCCDRGDAQTSAEQEGAGPREGPRFSQRNRACGPWGCSNPRWALGPQNPP